MNWGTAWGNNDTISSHSTTCNTFFNQSKHSTKTKFCSHCQIVSCCLSDVWWRSWNKVTTTLQLLKSVLCRTKEQNALQSETKSRKERTQKYNRIQFKGFFFLSKDQILRQKHCRCWGTKSTKLNVSICNELATCPGCTPPSPNVSWDWLQPPQPCEKN